MKAKDIIVDYIIRYGFQFLGAVVILTAGVFLATWLGNLLLKALSKRDMDMPVRLLIVRVVRLLVIGLTLVIALDKFGVQVAPLVAGIGVAGVGIGLAMQGVLGNLVSGIFLILSKPFRVGEYIEVLGVEGQVTMIDLFSTKLAHADRSRVVIPNRRIIGEVLHNYGAIRQIELEIGVSYDTDLAQAILVMKEVLGRNPRTLKDPAPVIGVAGLGDSSVQITAKPWVNLADYVQAKGELYQELVERLRDKNIEMPFPQREIRLLDSEGLPRRGFPRI